jgi:SAM-dependent methyltransferase
LLDLGCGKVPLYEAYRSLVSSVMCVDWGQSFHSKRHLDLEVDLTGPLPIESGRFDTIVLSDVLEHIPNPANIWSEMARVLRPGGKIVMNVPFLYWIHEQPFDYHRYTEFALRRYARDSGLDVLELESLGGSPEVLADITAKNVCLIPRIGPASAAFIQALAAELTRTGFGRRISQATRLGFPLGYGLVLERR